MSCCGCCWWIGVLCGVVFGGVLEGEYVDGFCGWFCLKCRKKFWLWGDLCGWCCGLYLVGLVFCISG